MPTYQFLLNGIVTSVNGTFPDADGNVVLALPPNANMANGDQPVTGNRTHAGGGYFWKIVNLSSFRISTNGVLSTDVIAGFDTGSGSAMEIFGNKLIKHYGNTEVTGYVRSPLLQSNVWNDVTDNVELMLWNGSRLSARAPMQFNTVNYTSGSGSIWNNQADTLNIMILNEDATALFYEQLSVNKGLLIKQSGGAQPTDASAMLEIRSTEKGFLPPRMTSVQRNAITLTPGLKVFDTTTGTEWSCNGTDWLEQ